MCQSLNVIVIDDEPDVASSFAMLLEQFGCEVEAANSGEDALEILEDWTADVAFVDLGMPKMNGFQLADQIRERGASTPRLVALTGYGRDEDRERTTEHGFVDHLVKPPDPDEIIAILDAARADKSGTDRPSA